MSENQYTGHDSRCGCLACSAVGYVDPAEQEIPRRRRVGDTLPKPIVNARPIRVGDRVSFTSPTTGRTEFGTVSSAPRDGRQVGVKFDGRTYRQDWHGTASLTLISE